MRKNERRLKNIFRSDWYLHTYRDVEEAGIDPWDHFLSGGLVEGRSPNPLFDIKHLPESIDKGLYNGATILDYLNGLHKVVAPSALFDQDWYRSQAGRSITPDESVLEHYVRVGADSGCEPCPLFVTSAFRTSEHTTLTPLEEFASNSLKWRRNIGIFFSGSDYLNRNPDADAANFNPLVHFLLTGEDRDRFSNDLIDVDLASKWLPEATSYSQLVGSLRSGRAITPEHVANDPLAQELLAHALRSDRRRTFAWAKACAGTDPSNRWAAYLSERAKAIPLRTTAEPRVSVIVPTFNDAEMTIACVEAVADSTIVANCECIVIDDGSDPEVVAALSEVSGIELIRKPENGGYSSAVATGVHAARGDYLFLHNNDAEVLPNTLEALVDELDQNSDIGAAGCLVIDAELRVQEAGCAVFTGGFAHQLGHGESPLNWKFRYPRDVDYCSAVGLMIGRKTWDEVGGYSAEFEPAYYEDADLCMKVTHSGKRVRFLPPAALLHNEGSSHGRSLHGIKAYQYRNRRLFAEKWLSELTGRPLPSDLDSRGMNRARIFDRQPGEDVVVVDHQVPDPSTDAGSVRMAEILKLLVSEGRVVHFVGQGNHLRSKWSFTDEASSIHWAHGADGLAEALNQVRARRPLVIVSRPDVYVRALPTVLDVCPDAFIAFDTVDAHGLRIDRELDLARSENNANVSKLEQSAVAAKRLETTAVRSADCVISVSDRDSDYFRSLDDSVPIIKIPLIHKVVEVPPVPAGRSDIVFVGGYRHTPNINAARVAVNEIMPEVWAQRPSARLILAGSHPPEEVLELAGPRVLVPGWLDSLDEIYSAARVVIAPIRIGAGTNGKVTESLSLGIPVVTTAIGAEGAGLTHGDNALIADEAETFARHILELFEDDITWRSLSKSGLDHVSRHFGHEGALSGIRKLLIK